jgi:hypothetical protein
MQILLNTAYVQIHNGLGDHLVLNGLIHSLIERWNLDELFLFCWNHNLTNLEKLYEGTKVTLIPLHINCGKSEEQQVDEILIKQNISKEHYKDYINWETGKSGKFWKIGFDWYWEVCLRDLQNIANKITCDECFYKQAKEDFSTRFDKFKYNRNEQKEKEVYQLLNPNNEDYIFVAVEDYDRGLVCPTKNKIRTDLKIIENPKNINIFDLAKIYENAKEIHLMGSSIACLLEAKIFNINGKMFYHSYRGHLPSAKSTRHNWIYF